MIFVFSLTRCRRSHDFILAPGSLGLNLSFKLRLQFLGYMHVLLRKYKTASAAYNSCLWTWGLLNRLPSRDTNQGPIHGCHA